MHSIIETNLPTWMLSQSLMTVCRTSNVVAWIWDLDRNLVTLVIPGEQPSIKQLTSWESIFNANDLTRLNEAVRSAIQNGEAGFELRCSPRLRSGQAANVACHGQLVLRSHEGGTNTTLFGVFKEGRLRRTLSGEREGEPCMQTQTRVLANMSHEIRTPLNGIMGMVELALDAGPTREVQSYLQGIRTSSNALLRVLNDILDFSKAASGFLSIESEPFRLRRILEEVMDLFAADSCRKKLVFLCELRPEVPDYLCGDASRIRQILLNLLGNAIKFTPSGVVTLRVSHIPISDKGINIRFCVEDTGIGISKENLENIFVPFFQIDSSLTRKFGGTGLGLAISKALAEKMGGTLSAESNIGEGSRFTLELKLPLHSASDDLQSTPSLPACRLLVAISHRETREGLEATLTSLGHAVSVVPDYQATADALLQANVSNAPFDLLVIDSDIAVANNSALLDQYRHDIGGVPRYLDRCILVSNALRFSSDGALCDRFGIRARLRTPWTDHQVLEALSKALHRNEPPSSNEAREDPLQVDYGFIASQLSQEAKEAIRLLVVDDDSMNLAVLKKILLKSGFEVDTATDGENALHLFESHCYDAIIMDIQMPVMDGIVATEAIRVKEMRRSWVGSPWRWATPIIGLTADVHSSVRDAALSAGMNELLMKPLPRQRLIEAVMRLVRQSRNTPALAKCN